MITTLQDYKEKVLLRSQKHPTLPLEIWNYTEKVQYNNLWDGVTLNHRATIRDLQGNLVAKSFSKFFNIEENKHTPSDRFEVYEKLDGSLGILFFYQNQWVFASRGSFASDQAIKGFEILQKYDFTKLDESLSYVFEIIYPENRIVVDYGSREELVLLAVFDKYGDELPEINVFSTILPVVKKYDFQDWQAIKSLNWGNSEGFVVRFSNGSRCKIKFDNYVELHRILSDISENRVYELFISKRNIQEMLDVVPDEFHAQVKKWHDDLCHAYTEKEIEIKSYFDELPKFETRKDLALHIKDYKHKSVIFSLYDNRDIFSHICKLIEPSASKPLIFEKN